MDGEEFGLIEDVESGSGGEGGQEEIESEPQGEGAVEGGEGEVQEGEEGGEPSEEGERAPGKAFPTELRRALREFNAGNPDFARKYPRLERQLTAALYKAGHVDKLGGLQQLRAASEQLESFGGPQALAEMADEVQASRLMEQGFQQGDPILVDTWAKEYPDGFKALVGPALEKLEVLDLPAHDRAISGPMYKALDRCGVIGTVQDLETAIASQNAEGVQKHFGALKQFLQELRNFATKAKAPDPLKAERDRLAAERGEIQTERQRTFYGGVRTDVGVQTTGMINRMLRQELAGKKLRVDTANRIRRQINEDLTEAVNTAPGYAEKYKAVMNANDHGKAVNFIVSNARQKIPMIVKRVLRDFNLEARQATPGRRPAGAPPPRRAEGSNIITGRPKTGDVDFTRTDKATYLGQIGGHGQAYLRNGKLAKW